MSEHISIVGGGLAGLTAAIACAEHGRAVTLYEAHQALGGEARSTAGPYVVNEGPHAMYDGVPFRWLLERGLARPFTGVGWRELLGIRVRHHGRIRATLPPAMLRLMASRRVQAPVDEPFGSWAGQRFGAEAASVVCGVAGVLTYEADPGRLSAAFVWERFCRAAAPTWPAVKYFVGGWGALVDRLAERARELGVTIETEARISELPPTPTIVATGLPAARTLLGDDSLRWESGDAVLLDVALRPGPQDVYLVFDLDQGGFVVRYSSPMPQLAPPGESLYQAELPVRRGETREQARARLETLMECAAPGWAQRRHLAARAERPRPDRRPRPARLQLEGPPRDRPRRRRLADR